MRCCRGTRRPVAGHEAGRPHRSQVWPAEGVFASGAATDTERALIGVGVLEKLRLPNVILAGTFGLREIGNAMVYFLGDEVELGHDELFEWVVHAFGGKKRTSRARIYFDLALQRAVDDNRIKYEGSDRYILG